MKPWLFVLLISLVGALGMATLTILDLRLEVKSAQGERDFYGARYQECFARCGP